MTMSRDRPPTPYPPFQVQVNVDDRKRTEDALGVTFSFTLPIAARDPP
jgi:hypothetical protein